MWKESSRKNKGLKEWPELNEHSAMAPNARRGILTPGRLVILPTPDIIGPRYMVVMG
jgi:hypothetical protein